MKFQLLSFTPWYQNFFLIQNSPFLLLELLQEPRNHFRNVKISINVTMTQIEIVPWSNSIHRKHFILIFDHKKYFLWV